VTIRRGRCACGELRITCRGNPAKISVCHCAACKRRTGSAFGVAAFFSREQIQPEGEERTFLRVTDDGDEIVFHFCPSCGSSIYWEPSWKPDAVGVAAGAFPAGSFGHPDQSVCDAERFAWITLADDVTRRAN